jgi:hypothetical protein
MTKKRVITENSVHARPASSRVEEPPCPKRTARLESGGF